MSYTADELDWWDGNEGYLEQETFSLACTYLGPTKDAILINDGTRNMWIPRSEIRDELPKLAKGDIVTITIPEWLAKKKGLI